MKNIEATKVEADDEAEEPYNPFDDFSLWLQLAYMDFTFDFEEMTEAKE